MNNLSLNTRLAYERLLNEAENQRLLRQVEQANQDHPRSTLNGVGNRLIHLGRRWHCWIRTTGSQTYIPNYTIDAEFQADD